MDVDEQGSEGAAVTAIQGLQLTSWSPPPPPPPLIKVTKPFYFSIEAEGTPIFVGKVVDPGLA